MATRQLRDGKTPVSAMMKLIAKDGCILVWAWLPPVLDNAVVDIATMFVELPYMANRGRAKTMPCTSFSLASALEAIIA